MQAKIRTLSRLHTDNARGHGVLAGRSLISPARSRRRRGLPLATEQRHHGESEPPSRHPRWGFLHLRPALAAPSSPGIPPPRRAVSGRFDNSLPYPGRPKVIPILPVHQSEHKHHGSVWGNSQQYLAIYSVCSTHIKISHTLGHIFSVIVHSYCCVFNCNLVN